MIHPLLAVTAIVTTLAGTPGVAGHADGAANVATFNKPTQIAVDRANGDVYVTDRLNNEVRLVSAAGVVTTFLPGGKPTNFGGPVNGGIAIEPPGDYPKSYGYGRAVFIASSGNHIVVQRDIYGFPMAHDLPSVGVEDVPGAFDGDVAGGQQAVFNTPTALAIDWRRYPTTCCRKREYYVADTGNGSIRKVTREINFEAEYYSRFVTTVARGFVAPRGLAFGPDGSLYVSDMAAHTITRITADGTKTIVAGQSGVPGAADGPAGLLRMPTGIDVDDAGNVYIADTGNSAIRRLRPDGVLETVAGLPGEGGYADGEGAEARFNGPVGLQLAADGSLIVADTSNHVLRRIRFSAAPTVPRRRGVRH